MQIMKKHKSIIMVGALVLLFTGAFLLGNVYMQYRAEQTVQAVSKDMDAGIKTEETQQNLKEQVKKAEEADGWEISLQLAEDLLNEMPEAPLLQENATEDYGDSSLENFINDVNAVSAVENRGAKNVILQVCKDAGIDADTAKVSDLTKEQIAQIDQVVFQNSDHPKD